MNVVLVLLPVCGAAVVACVNGTYNRAIRRIALSFALVTFAASFLCTKLSVLPDILRSELSPLDLSVAAVLSGSFFFVLLARGLAARSETICALLFMAAGLMAILAKGLEQFLFAVLFVWVLAALLLQLRGLEKRESALRSLGGAAVLSVVLGIAALLGAYRNVLLGLSMVCLLGAFPAHLWLPRVLAQASFLLAVLAPVVMTRVAAAGYVTFCASEPNGVFAILGLAGVLWCSCASIASANLGEKLGYLVGVQSSLALWAIGKGVPETALLFLLVTAPPTVLWAIGSGILFGRLKHLDLEHIQGIGPQLPRLNLVFIAAVLGVALFPGTSSFAGIVLLLKHAGTWWERLGVGGAAVLLFISAGYAYLRLAFGEVSKELRRAGDLNRRELAAVIPVGLCVAVGLWPGFVKLIKGLIM